MNIRISVIVPSYKPKDYLWECLESLVTQTLSKDLFEVILVLNGCCDPWKGQIESYINKHLKCLNIHFIQIDVPGVSNARNVALDLVKGKYVTFIDDDDYVSPKYLELLYSKVSNDTIALAYPYAFYDPIPEKQLSPQQYKITDTYNRIAKEGRQEYTKARKYFSGPCMKLIPMSFIQKNRFNTSFKNGEDGLFMFLISNHFKFVDFAEKDCVYYRRYREGSAVSSESFRQRFHNCFRLMREYCRIYINGNHYHFSFFITRELGAIHTIVSH